MQFVRVEWGKWWHVCKKIESVKKKLHCNNIVQVTASHFVVSHTIMGKECDRSKRQSDRQMHRQVLCWNDTCPDNSKPLSIFYTHLLHPSPVVTYTAQYEFNGNVYIWHIYKRDKANDYQVEQWLYNCSYSNNKNARELFEFESNP